MFGLPGLSVATRRRACAGQAGVAGDVEAAVDMAGEIRPVEIGRRRRDGAVGRRREGVAIAGERAAQIGDQRVTLPVGDGEKFRRDHIERRALRHAGAAGIGVVAAGEFDRGLDQKAAGVIADRAERIVVDLEPLARRLADHGAGHRGRRSASCWRSPTAEPTAGSGRSRSAALTRRPVPGCRDRRRLRLAAGRDRASASCGCD